LENASDIVEQLRGRFVIGNAGRKSDLARESIADFPRGGCLVQTRFGTVDARRETKLDLLQRNLLA
jgi:hypothetical protein